MDSRTTRAENFKTRLGLKQHDPIMCQEQSTEEILFQHHVLRYYIAAYFSKYKLAIEVDRQGYNSRDIDYEIDRQKATENEFCCEFIRINPGNKNFDIFVEIGKIQNYIVKSTKKLTEESTKNLKNSN